jgi:release factor glutamine methyltransferase
MVVGIDINPYAVRCSIENAKLNKVENKMHFIQGDLFTPLKVGNIFDAILFNAPYLPTKSKKSSWLEYAWNGGLNGRQVIDRFICEVPKFVKEEGRIFILQSTLANVEKTIRRLTALGTKTRVIAECAMPLFEKIVLLQAQFP